MDVFSTGVTWHGVCWSSMHNKHTYTLFNKQNIAELEYIL